jgi:hypothetical protein
MPCGEKMILQTWATWHVFRAFSVRLDKLSRGLGRFAKSFLFRAQLQESMGSRSIQIYNTFNLIAAVRRGDRHDW